MTSIKKQSIIEYYKIILQKPVEAKTHSTYLNDVESEGKRADFVIRIKEGNLKIADIKSWWTHFKVNTKYHLKDCNCCTVIFKALTEGGSEDIVKVKQHEFATTDNLKEYALKLQSSVEQQSSMEMQEDAKEEL